MLASSTSISGKAGPHHSFHHHQLDQQHLSNSMNAWNRDYAVAPREGNRPSSASYATMPSSGSSSNSGLAVNANGPSWEEPDPLVGNGAAHSFEHGSSSGQPSSTALTYSTPDYYRVNGHPHANHLASMSKFYGNTASYAPIPPSNGTFAGVPGSTTSGLSSFGHSATYPQGAAYHYAVSPSAGSLEHASLASHLPPQERDHGHAMLDQQQLAHHPHHSHYPPPHHAHHVRDHPHAHELGDFRSQYLNPFEVKHRRRTTRSQFKVLEATFKENAKPNATMRKNLSQQLDMPLRAVQIWFQNRRAKAKAVTKKESANAGQVPEKFSRPQQLPGSIVASSSTNSTDDPLGILEDEERRYSSSSSSSLRPQTAGGESAMGFSTSSSSSAPYYVDAFKIPGRPLKTDDSNSGSGEGGSSSRRMTIGASPSQAAFAPNGFYQSPALSAASMSYSTATTASSHMSHSSSSTYESYSRPTSSSMSTTTNASYDERYRRGLLASPSLLNQESPQMPFTAHGAYSRQIPPPLDLDSKRPVLPDLLHNNVDAAVQQQQQDHDTGSAQGDDPSQQTSYWRY